MANRFPARLPAWLGVLRFAGGVGACPLLACKEGIGAADSQ